MITPIPFEGELQWYLKKVFKSYSSFMLRCSQKQGKEKEKNSEEGEFLHIF